MQLRSFILAVCPPLLALGPAGCAPAERSAADASAAVTAARPADLAAGRAVYQRNCIVCHLADGQGVPGAFPPLQGSSRLAEADPGRLIRLVLHGLEGPVEVAGVTYDSLMPPQGQLLQDGEIASVLTYVRHTWGRGAPPVSAVAVSAIRQNTRRSTPWTWAELHHP